MAYFLRLAWQASAPLITLLITVRAFAALSPLLNIKITAGIIFHTSNFDAQARSALIVDLILLISLNLLVQISGTITSALHRTYSLKLYDHISVLITQSVNRRAQATVENSDFQDRLQLLRSETYFRPLQYVMQIVSVFAVSLSILDAIKNLFDWKTVAVSVIVVLALLEFIRERILMRINVDTAGKLATHQRRRDYFFNVLISDRHSKEVRVLNLITTFTENYRKQASRIFSLTSRTVRIDLISKFAVVGVTLVTLFMLMAMAYYDILSNEIEPYQIYAILSYATLGLLNLSTVLNGAVDLNEDVIFARLLQDLTEGTPTQAASPEQRPTPHPPSVLETPAAAVDALIRIEQVTFCYPSGLAPAIKNVSLNVFEHEFVALTGRNGSGKSTVLKLLAGIYQPGAGHLYIGDQEVQVLPLGRNPQASTLLQDFSLYDVTIRENLKVANPDLSDEDLLAACEQTGFGQVMKHAAVTLDSVLGMTWPGGIELSGGQKQLLAVTRLVLEDAPILLLDEPTSALDTVTTAALFQTELRRRKNGQRRTILVATHDAAICQLADRVVEFSAGALQDRALAPVLQVPKPR